MQIAYVNFGYLIMNRSIAGKACQETFKNEAAPLMANKRRIDPKTIVVPPSNRPGTSMQFNSASEINKDKSNLPSSVNESGLNGNAHTAIGQTKCDGVVSVKTIKTTSKPENGTLSTIVKFPFGNVAALNHLLFPNQSRAASSQVLTTIHNVEFLLTSYVISVRYNLISKKLMININNFSASSENYDNSAMSWLISLAKLNGMSTEQVPNFVAAIGDQNQFNPVATWISSFPWDGKDRLNDFYNTLTAQQDFPEVLKRTILRRWLISCVAAALKPSGFRSRGVLTLQGPQSIGKTAWVSSLVSDENLRERTIKLDHHLDAGNKDSQISAISHWIVEIGELDGSLKKDVARLKGFLTSTHDKLRRPYAQTESEYPRRTVFCATVNDKNFLIDSTGNTRFWTIPVSKTNYDHGIDMQQLFAQIAVLFNNNEQWWLTSEEEISLEKHNNNHRSNSAIRERILDAVDLVESSELHFKMMSSIELLREIGIDNPTNPQCKECASVLREYFGESKKNNGTQKWKIPLKKPRNFTSPTLDDDRY